MSNRISIVTKMLVATQARALVILMILGVAALILAPAPALAGDGEMAKNAMSVKAEPSILDGKVFRGRIGARGNDPHQTDTWVFENGVFRSTECVKCGFPASAYEASKTGETVRFETAGICPKTDARIVWRGTVKDGRIEGTMTWTKERWYRDIKKTFWFKGQVTDQERADADALADGAN